MTEPYRNEIPALEEQLRELEDALAHIDRVSERRPVIAREAEELKKKLAAARARDQLDKLRIATPCTARWEEMVGDERVRHCGACRKDVFNVASMSRADALQLISVRGHEGLCLRLYRRADGTVLTADCPVGVRAKKARRLVVLGAGAVAAGGALLAFATPAGKPAMGDVVSTATTPGRVDTTATGQPSAMPVEEPILPVAGTVIAPDPIEPPSLGSAYVPPPEAPKQPKQLPNRGRPNGKR